jgi:NAD(P)-dependent dehydrogenase (short-subunit alcohol dehydrogenase family)
VVLLTGATGGVGGGAAAEFAARGATLTIVGRDRAKTEQTAESIRRTTGNPAVDCLIADLSLRSGMSTVVTEFRARNERLDVLVNNAGALFRRPVITVDGLEKTFALNHLAYFAVTTGLLDLLRNTPGARVVNTASTSHRSGRLDLERVADRKNGGGYRAYCDSKLANVLFTRELARRLEPDGVTANCLHPGFTRSRLFAENRGLFAYLARSPLAVRMARTPERGAETLVWLATSPEAGAHSGQYFVDRKVATVSRRAQDADLGARLWTLSGHLLSEADHGGSATVSA